MTELGFVELVLQLLLFKLLVEFQNRKKCRLSKEAASTTVYILLHMRKLCSIVQRQNITPFGKNVSYAAFTRATFLRAIF